MKNKKLIVILCMIFAVIVAGMGVLYVTDSLPNYLNPIKIARKIKNTFSGEETKTAKKEKKKQEKEKEKEEAVNVDKDKSGAWYKISVENKKIPERTNNIVKYMKAMNKKGIKTSLVLVPP